MAVSNYLNRVYEKRANYGFMVPSLVCSLYVV